MQQRCQSSAGYAAPQTFIAERFRKRGLLSEQDPLSAFSLNSEFAVLDEIGRYLPSMLHDRGFRQYARTLKIPLGRNVARNRGWGATPRARARARFAC